MGIQQGFCNVAPNILIAAWKADPAYPVAGNHFPFGVEDQISWASLYNSSPNYWSMNGTMPANTSIGPALACDQNLNPSGPGPSIYAVWKGEEQDTRLFFARLTLPFNLIGQPSDPESQSWNPQQQIPGAVSTSSPSITVVGEVGSSAFAFATWSGTANGGPIPENNSDLWYSITPIPTTPGYIDNLSPATARIPGASSSTGASVAVAENGNLWVSWYDTAFKQWCYIIGEVNGLAIQWSSGPNPITAQNPANGAGYFLAAASLGSQGDPYGVYAAWSDASGKIWVSGIANLASGSASPAPLPSGNSQAVGNNGCALASLYQVVNGLVTEVLWAMWADTSGQLHYASSTDGTHWQDYGNLSNATTAPDSSLHFPFPFPRPFPPIHIPIKF